MAEVLQIVNEFSLKRTLAASEITYFSAIIVGKKLCVKFIVSKTVGEIPDDLVFLPRF